MKIRITKMSDKQKKLAKKYPRVEASSCSAMELAMMEQVRRKITDCMAPQYDTVNTEIVTINGKKYVEVTIRSKHDNKEYKGQAKFRRLRNMAESAATLRALNKATEAKCGSKTTIKDV